MGPRRRRWGCRRARAPGPAPGGAEYLPAATGSAPATAEDAAVELARAREEAPYAIRLPAWIPTGYELRRVSFDSDPTAHAFSVDLKYVNAEDEVVHVWQSNLTPEQVGATDPLAILGSTPIVVGATIWVATELAERVGRTKLTYRDSEGITITVDSRDLTDSVRVAESLTAAR